ncbi:SrfA family protein [Erwinia persicina]|uniref:SrfA family protein n=1 Tax=Erwinia persicina TaxID=55211 RepID=UPI0017801ED3|nr:virulence effector protein [Erwinia persicina]
MAKIFLRSGNLDAVLALGENGQPVYLSALQLRETLRLRKQSQVADCLAIPQPDDAGTRLDWYSPVAGKVTSWAAASNSARTAALSQLQACQTAIAEIGERARQSDKPSQKLFGALLNKALQFPDQNYVYLVGGKPVITFWGFVSLDKKSRQDVFDCLQIEDDEPKPGLSLLAPAPVATPLSVAASVSPVIAPLITPEPAAAATVPVPPPVVVPPMPALDIIDEPEDVADETPSAALPVKPKVNIWLRYGWVLPAVALLVVFGFQLKKGSDKPAEVAPDAPVARATPSVPAVTSAVTPAIAQPAPVADVKPTTLPLAAAVIAPVTPAPAPAPAPAVETVAEARPVARDDLVLPGDAVKLGSTKFLNGSWRVLVQKNLPTGTPPMLKYQMKNGKGTARITQGDGVSCKVEVFAGLMSSGNLVINSRTKARCSDGSRYQMPELVCKQGLTGPAECSGSYNADTVLPMTMKRESKS